MIELTRPGGIDIRVRKMRPQLDARIRVTRNPPETGPEFESDRLTNVRVEVFCERVPGLSRQQFEYQERPAEHRAALIEPEHFRHRNLAGSERFVGMELERLIGVDQPAFLRNPDDNLVR